MKKTVMLDYTFLFEPGKAWANLYQFEQELIQFFAERDMECETISMAQGQTGRRALMICPKEKVSVSDPVRMDVKSPAEQKKKVQEGLQSLTRGKDGKYK